jgi:hypothetical protein
LCFGLVDHQCYLVSGSKDGTVIVSRNDYWRWVPQCRVAKLKLHDARASCELKPFIVSLYEAGGWLPIHRDESVVDDRVACDSITSVDFFSPAGLFAFANAAGSIRLHRF